MCQLDDCNFFSPLPIHKLLQQIFAHNPIFCKHAVSLRSFIGWCHQLAQHGNQRLLCHFVGLVLRRQLVLRLPSGQAVPDVGPTLRLRRLRCWRCQHAAHEHGHALFGLRSALQGPIDSLSEFMCDCFVLLCSLKQNQLIPTFFVFMPSIQHKTNNRRHQSQQQQKESMFHCILKSLPALSISARLNCQYRQHMGLSNYLLKPFL